MLRIYIVQAPETMSFIKAAEKVPPLTRNQEASSRCFTRTSPDSFYMLKTQRAFESRHVDERHGHSATQGDDEWRTAGVGIDCPQLVQMRATQ